jgi:hypothetical protein
MWKLLIIEYWTIFSMKTKQKSKPENYIEIWGMFGGTPYVSQI